MSRPDSSLAAPPPLEASSSHNEPVSPPPFIQHGTVSVLHNQILVTQPEPGGSFATLTVPVDRRIQVFIDDTPTSGQVVLTGNQTITVKFPQQTEAARKFALGASEDRLRVSVQVDVTNGTDSRLKDVGAERSVLLAIEEIAIPPAATPPVKVLSLLRESGFRGNIDEQALAAVCEARGTLVEDVLFGIPPKPGLPARYSKVYVPAEPDPVLRRMQLSTVVAGTTIAVYEPGIEGVPGLDVLGKEIPVRQDSRVPLLGKGVIEVNGQIVAARNGRLIFNKRKIDVVPELVLANDVDPKQGNIEFDGSVVIHGSVLDGAKVKATGTVTVYGNVVGAYVLGEQGVTVKGNAIQSKILAGYAQFLYTRLRQLNKTILLRLDGFYRDYKSLVSAAKTRSGGERAVALIPQMLFEKRYTVLDAHLTEFVDEYDDLMTVDSHYRELVQHVKAKWVGIQRTKLTDSDILQLIRLLGDYQREVVQSNSGDPASIRVSSATSSFLEASGNIVVAGPGTFSTSLQSAASVTVQGSVRGGFIVAQQAVRIKELGTPYGAECSVRVKSNNGFIAVQTRHVNTLLDVAGRRDRNLVTEYKVRMQKEVADHAHSRLARR